MTIEYSLFTWFDIYKYTNIMFFYKQVNHLIRKYMSHIFPVDVFSYTCKYLNIKSLQFFNFFLPRVRLKMSQTGRRSSSCIRRRNERDLHFRPVATK